MIPRRLIMRPDRSCTGACGRKSGVAPGGSAERGMALFVVLVMLLVVTLIGLAATRGQALEIKMAANLHNHNIAMQATEAALRNAEDGILQGIYTGFASDTAGQYIFDPTSTSAPEYLVVDWTDSTQWLAYSGPAIASDNASQAPQFIIEQLPAQALPGDPLGVPEYGGGVPPVAVYRVTAHGSGGDASSIATLQSIVH